jgi:hypothetical protein
VAGRVALVQSPDGHDGFAYPVKRIVQNGERWWLRLDNPERPSLEASADTTPIAQLVATIKPETQGPVIGERLAPDEIGAAFGLASATLLERTARHEGHLFLVITDKDHFSEPDRVLTIITDRRPGETAFVLARSAAAAPLRYCGVARWLEPDGPWSLPALEFQTWRALGRGRECARCLPAAAVERATTFLDALLLCAPPGTWLARDGERCRILERTPAGVRIDGGDGGSAPRQVSATDLAWVMLAAQGVTEDGGLLDEAREPASVSGRVSKGSTRWIDTGWAIALFAGVVDRQWSSRPCVTSAFESERSARCSQSCAGTTAPRREQQLLREGLRRLRPPDARR